MSYTTGIIGGVTKSIHTSTPNVACDGSGAHNVWDETFDFSGLGIGDGYRLTFQVVANTAARNKKATVMLEPSGIQVLDTPLVHLKHGVELVVEVRKYDEIRCFKKGVVDCDNSLGLTGTDVENNGAESNIDYFSSATRFILIFETTVAGDLTLELARVETITNK